MGGYFQSEAFLKAMDILKTEFPLAIWETLYVTVLSTFFAIVIGLPLGVLLVAGENGRILKVPAAVLHVINVIINLLRSVPFLILMIMVFPLTRLIVGTVVGTPATVVPLVIAAFPFVARLAEGSLREINQNYKPEYYRNRAEYGRVAVPDNRKGYDTRKRTLAYFKRNDRRNHRARLFRNERHYRRRRSR